LTSEKIAGDRFYRPELDVLRFFAFLSVFLAHTLPTNPSSRLTSTIGGLAAVVFALSRSFLFGLGLFFTLSAYLICELLLRERTATGAVKVRQFYVRRILRIWPLYFFAVACGLVYALLPGSDHSGIAAMAWNAVFMGAWYAVLHGWTQNPMSPLWSISVEEQFYLFVPWIVKFFSRKWLYAFCLALIVLANILLVHFGNSGAKDPTVWANSLVQFEFFAGGILVSLVLRGGVPGFAIWQRVMLCAGAWLSWFIACYWLNAMYASSIGEQTPGGWALAGGYGLGVAGAVLLLIAFLGADKRLLAGWLVYLGRISYGLYVFHFSAIYIVRALIPKTWPLTAPVSLLKLLLPLALTIPMAALSYRYLERPFLRLKKKYSVIESQPLPES
jgi:peptidoglycan/LPS O-acetylase OafA/YrhL